MAARAAVLVAHLRAGSPFDFATMRFTGSNEEVQALRAVTLNGHSLSWIDGVKAVNPEAYYYWYQAIQLSQPQTA
jgi:hypothetical protein